MYLAMVVLGATHGLIFLPVLLSYIGKMWQSALCHTSNKNSCLWTAHDMGRFAEMQRSTWMCLYHPCDLSFGKQRLTGGTVGSLLWACWTEAGTAWPSWLHFAVLCEGGSEPLWSPESNLISVFQPGDRMVGGSNKPPLGHCSCICGNNLALQWGWSKPCSLEFEHTCV